MAELVTDENLSRARHDLAFRQKFMADNLDRLLEALNRARRSTSKKPEHAKLIREGVDLAVKLAELLNRPVNGPDSRAA